jgi:uncharacterized membrane protein
MNYSTPDQLENSLECAKSTVSKENKLNQTPDSTNFSSIFKKPKQLTNDPEIIYSAIPLMDNKEIFNKSLENQKNDSKCTRFMRKKFLCIVVLLLLCIAILEFVTTITEKLSDYHVNSMYTLLSNTMQKVFYKNETFPINVIVNTTNDK